ncbi:MAG: alcohol dehydrogenase catalytic domain-containing protein [Bryobacterales bacterium]|nr:alcohol dehydrogenase catalytic domain-containing protein [Bryobacterales bacterium]
MRVAELYEPKKFRLVQGSIPGPGPGEVQVRVSAVGICGSDLHSYLEGSVGDVPCRYPMVLGHEPAGAVVSTGPGVSGWEPGMRAAFEPAIYCYHCEFCLAGHHNVCARLRFLSQPGDPGFFRDFVNLPAHNLLPLPSGLSLRDATMIEPLAVVVHSMKFAALAAGETAAVFGAGPIGLFTIALLKLSGASRIWAVEPVPHRRELARLLGADAVADPASVDPAAHIWKETGRRGVDVSIDCAAKAGSVNACIHATRHAGRIVVTGIPSEIQVPLDFHSMRRKELALYNVRRSCHESQVALGLLVRHPDRFAPIITHTRPIEEIGEAFGKLERYEDGIGKLVVTLD